MRRIYTLGTVFVVCIFIISTSFFTDGGRKSAGAPWGNTGAPGEATCAKAGCHSDAKNGIGTFAIFVGDQGLTYAPGVKYQLKVELTQPGLKKNGFQLVVLRDADSTNAGTLSLIDAIRTQLVDPNDSLSLLYNRRYATHTYDGGIPTSPTGNEYYFDWTAPQTDIGPISFYGACIVANVNSNEQGDTLYMTSRKLTFKDNPPGISEYSKFRISVYPNPATKYITISMDAVHQSGNYTFRLYNLNGSIVTKLYKHETRIELNRFQSGMYFYSIMIDGLLVRSEKIMVIK